MKAKIWYKVAFEDFEYIQTESGINKNQLGSFLVAVLDTPWREFAAEGRRLAKETAKESLCTEFRQWYKTLIREISSKHPLLKILIEKELPDKMKEVLFQRFGEDVKTEQKWKFVEGLVGENEETTSEHVWVEGWMMDVCVRFDGLADLVKHAEDAVNMVLNDRNRSDGLTILKRYALFINGNWGKDFIGFFSEQYYPRMHHAFEITVDSVLNITKEEKHSLDVNDLKKAKVEAHSYWSTHVLEAMFVREFHVMALKEDSIRRCENCGRYFLPYSIVSIYCDGPDPNRPEKTCKEIGAQTKHQKKVTEDEAKKLFRRVNNRHQNWARRNKKNSRLAKEYLPWKEWAETLFAEVRTGNRTFEEFSVLIDEPTQAAFERLEREKTGAKETDGY